ncbi:mannitol dehydrogenase family protein [Actinoplanes derwentensis]|uniref:Mannitol-1-phosphate 5-dehydrogenase n=1 Tax=Actinoplanes derwentensis TaxID=113562 RepID=A0A1H1XHZ3_9ACTN|nr:mannitol dehydrogenase family protein [Actinoplanes derwentensis]GID87182.1 mannitol-1-phosphate 5-dehydrogenase [Actinoplanes derwentensis]SDT08449.1 fructuronate reductase [Actinoplanes derwentensis]
MSRMLHLGLGNFFRAHQAWYTAAAGGWDIAAFTGRSPAVADALNAQGCRYTLITRGPSHDTDQELTLAAAYPGADDAAWLREWAAPDLAVVTLTVTEAAYRPGPLPRRLAAGLTARRDTNGGPVTLISCDNLPGNGTVLARLITQEADPALREWIAANVSFVDTVVDRITPASTPADGTAVVTEPFTEWVLAGDFPAGRPAWEEAGARFVDDVAPYEQRKLWLLNGGHTLLAYVGSLRGHITVASAVADPYCRGLLEQWWDEADARLPEAGVYRTSLLERWSNARIEHRLAQIAADGSVKIPVRIVPALLRARAEGRLPRPAVELLAAWTRHLRGESVPVRDTAAPTGAVPVVLRSLDERLAADEELVAAVFGAL